MSLVRLAFSVCLIACGSRSSPPAKPAPTADCKADATLLGTPCSEEGKVCGASEAAKATGFSNVVRCSSGTWQNVEVPPPPPP